MRVNPAIHLVRLQGVVLALLAGAGAGLALARLWPVPGALLGAAVAAALSLRWTGARVARALSRGDVTLRDSLLAYREGRGGSLRPSLERWLVARLQPVIPWPEAVVAAGLVGLAAVAWSIQPRTEQAPLAAAEPSRLALTVRADIVPPAYAGQPARSAEGTKLSMLRGSAVTLSFTTAGSLEVDEPGSRGRMTLEGNALRLTADRSRTLRAISRQDTQTVTAIVELEVFADAAPRVELLAPDADRVVTEAPAPFVVSASARDDLGVERGWIKYTLSQGTGEAVRFTSGSVPVRVTRDGPLRAALEARIDPGALGMARGDTLVVWAEAADGNTVDGPGVGRSSARLVRWVVPVADLSGSGTMGVPPPTSMLTQRELLRRTEKLVASGRRGQALAEAAAELAQDQRSIRLSFGQLLAEHEGDALELDMDDAEAVEATDVRSRSLLAQAVSAMWDAESELNVGSARTALAPMRVAVKRLDEAFALVRMSLRPLKQPDKVIDETRRLKGEQRGLAPERRATPPGTPADPQLLELAHTLGVAARRGLSADEARALGDTLWSSQARAGIPLAELASRLYAATDEAARVEAARSSARALGLALRPAPLRIPHAGPSLGL